MTFKARARIAMERWTKEGAEWVYRSSRPNSIEQKVAKWVLKKKFNISLPSEKSK